MSSDLGTYVQAHKKLAALAAGDDGVVLSSKEARALVEHMDWLDRERNELIDVLPDDD